MKIIKLFTAKQERVLAKINLKGAQIKKCFSCEVCLMTNCRITLKYDAYVIKKKQAKFYFNRDDKISPFDEKRQQS